MFPESSQNVPGAFPVARPAGECATLFVETQSHSELHCETDRGRGSPTEDRDAFPRIPDALFIFF